ncbi:MAG TPA: DUF4431 domain-containing protein [Bacteroidia bacterium]|nr:DUF4431 domain-containing protein [Bacteroidia bacterium]
MKFLRFTVFIPAFFIFSSCSNQEPAATKSDSVKKDSTESNADFSDWRKLTESWTASLNLKNASIMKSFYSDSVIYYGDNISGADVVKRQQEYFSTNPDYHQKITEYMGEEEQPDGNWRVRITKQVTAGGKTADYPASLIFGKQNGIWKIIAESDDITDLKKGQPVNVHYAPEEVVVEGILEENAGFTPSKEGDPKSDNKELYYVVWPSQPLNVFVKEGTEKGVNVNEMGIDRIQLRGDVLSITPFLNKKVRVTGTLAHAVTVHDFTKVILNIEKIEAMNN